MAMIVRIAAAVLFALTFAAHAGAAELKVLSSGAVKDAYLDLIPQFEKATGHKVTVTWAGTVDIKKRIAAGEVYDVVMIAAPEIEAFTKDGHVKPGSKVDLVRSSVGV